MQRVVSTVIFGLALSLASRAASADDPDGLALAAAIQEAFVKAIENAEKSVVSISRDKLQPSQQSSTQAGRQFGRVNDLPPNIASIDYIPNEFGAGIVIDETGLILTNYHLVRGGPAVDPRSDYKADQALYVRLPDRRGFEARIFAADPRSDLAVLKIMASDLKPIRIGNANAIRKGQFVIALGNPYQIARDGTASASWGIVGNLIRQAELDPDVPLRERSHKRLQNQGMLIQVDTRLDLGTSGGALIDLQGNLIGVTTSLASIVGYEKSAGYAVPIDDSTRRIIEALRQGKEVEYGFLGVDMHNDLVPGDDELTTIGERFKQYGAARIKSVIRNLPAERAGLRADDLVLRIGDKPILSQSDLMREVGLLAPGTVARFRVWRPIAGRDLELPVEVGKWPVVNEEAVITATRLREPWRGIVYDYPTSRFRLFDHHTPERNAGLLVLEVLPNSPAETAGIRRDDLITQVRGKPVRTPRELQELVQGDAGPVPLQVVPAASVHPAPRTVEIKPR